MLCYEQPMPSGATRDAGAETAETLEGVLERFVFVSDDEEFGVALVRPDDGELVKAVGAVGALHAGERRGLRGSGELFAMQLPCTCPSCGRRHAG